MPNESLHVERVGDELLLTVQPEDGGDSVVVSLPVPDGVDELVASLRAEQCLDVRTATAGALLAHATEFSFPHRVDGWGQPITVAWRGRVMDPDTGPPDGGWAVLHGRHCLAADGTWEMEPQPSERDEAYFARCRFTRDEALARATAFAADPS